MFQIVKLVSFCSLPNREEVWFSLFGLTGKPFPICPQLQSLHICPASQVSPAHLQLHQTTSRCPWCQQLSAWRMHLPPRLLHSLQGPSSPASGKPGPSVFPHLSTSHFRSQLSTRPLLQGRNHLNPCNKMFGTWHVSQCWLNEQLWLETEDS